MGSIRSAIEEAVGYLTEHPEEARYTDSPATARLEHRLIVRVEGPDGASVNTDMPVSVGGEGSAPPPGWLFRASVASCLATLIAMRAAQEEVRLTGLEVMVDSESDDRGILGLDPEVPAGPLSMRIRVRADSPDDSERLDAIVKWGVEHCPVYDAVRRRVDVSLE